ncbi:MAG: HupE/UreJ family protein [Nitratireductor sp.]|nr:HupE/UreJ family protein [Nitratireductor sp.]
MACFFLFMASLAAGLVAHAPNARAHEILPAIADFHADDAVAGQGRYRIDIRLNAEALLAGIGAEHADTDDSPNAAAYNELRELAPEALAARFSAFADIFREAVTLRFDGVAAVPETADIDVPEVGDVAVVRSSVVSLSGPLPAEAKTLQWAWPEAYGASVIRMNPPGAALGEGYSAYLGPGEASEAIDIAGSGARSLGEVILNYVKIGYEHILPKGLDHILFVAGLFLLSNHWRPLLWQVTAFTIAHTITLALATLGYVAVSPAIVEPLIAASIVYVGVENLLTNHLNPWRPLIVFCFGLLHGLGFAGVLGEIGLSPGHYVAGLIAFNVGVELGQLSVIALCYLAVGLWFGRKRWYRAYITNPASVAIAVIAAWWFYERTFLA